MTLVELSHWVIALCALGALCVSIYNSLRIREVHMVVNSRLTKMLQDSNTLARAEGFAKGLEEKPKEK